MDQPADSYHISWYYYLGSLLEVISNTADDMVLPKTFLKTSTRVGSLGAVWSRADHHDAMDLRQEAHPAQLCRAPQRNTGFHLNEIENENEQSRFTFEQVSERTNSLTNA